MTPINPLSACRTNRTKDIVDALIFLRKYILEKSGDRTCQLVYFYKYFYVKLYPGNPLCVIQFFKIVT
jgi:hypothetical protein